LAKRVIFQLFQPSKSNNILPSCENDTFKIALLTAKHMDFIIFCGTDARKTMMLRGHGYP
jgi:hypothetical protein